MRVEPDSVFVLSPATAYQLTRYGPLGALIVRWIQARVESPSDVFGWQYIDAFDIHTIAFTHKQQVRFINIHGRIEGGQRVYDLQDLGYALELRFDIVKVEA